MKIRSVILSLALVATLGVGSGPALGSPSGQGSSKPSMDDLMAKVEASLSSSRRRYWDMSHLIRTRPKRDNTLAPYFHVPGRKGTEALPLKKTSAKVQIAGVIARVQVSQLYENTGKTPIEAIYVFPASTRAAVHGMRMKIGERTVEAKIQERGKARRTYANAREAGKRTSLLEQQRPNVFTMSVANIMPGDKISVELDYSELLVPSDGVYEFVYPTVVGPRFGGGAHPVHDKWIANPYLRAGQKAPYKFGFTAHVESPIGIAKLSSPSHDVKVKFASAKSADVTLAEGDGGDRDLILRYSLAGGKIETGVMLYEHDNEKYFLVMMEPPKRVKPKHVPRREYIFVVDVSGSMHGFPLRTSKKLIRNLFKGLTSRDYFNVVLFAGRAGQMHRTSVPATAANLRRALRTIDRQRGGGGTHLLAGLRRAFQIPKVASEGVSRNVVVVTDGYVSVEAQTFNYIRKNLNRANVFAFGIGSTVNRGLIEGMARAGMGHPFVVLESSRAAAQAAKFKTYIEAPVLTGINIAFEGVQTTDVAPKSVPDLLAQRPLIVFGKYSGSGKIRISGTTGSGKFEKVMRIDSDQAKKANAPLRTLWARKWVETLMDQYAMLPGDKEIRQAVTDVGLNYKLLTRFTSFVAVDSEVARTGGSLVRVKQPLPLPKGVSNYAVGGNKLSSRLSRTAYGYFGGGSSGGRLAGAARSAPRYRPRVYRPAASPEPGVAGDTLLSLDVKERDVKTESTPAVLNPFLQSSKSRITGEAGEHQAGRLEVTGVENLKASVTRLFAERVRHYFAKCLSGASAGVVTITIKSSGDVSLGGRSIPSCFQWAAQRLAKQLASNAMFWRDRGKSVVITLRIR